MVTPRQKHSHWHSEGTAELNHCRVSKDHRPLCQVKRPKRIFIKDISASIIDDKLWLEILKIH